MKKTFFALIALVLALSMLAGCLPFEKAPKSSSSAKVTTGAPATTTQNKLTNSDKPSNGGDGEQSGGNEDADKPFENKIVMRSDNFTVDSKMLKYLYVYIINVYYQYYGQYAPYYVTAEVVEGEAKNLLAYCEAAKAAGFALSTDDLLEIAESVTAHEAALKENGYESIDKYYGTGVDAEALIEATKLQYLSQKYNSAKTEEIRDSLMADKSGLEKYFDEHKELLFGNCFSATVNSEEYYERLAAAKTKEEIIEIMEEFCIEQGTPEADVMGEKATYYPVLKENETLTEFEAWFFDGTREKGDIFRDPDAKTVYVVSLPAKKYTDFVKSAGHILIIPEGSGEAYKKAAKAKAEAILTEYLTGESTKEAFGALGEKNTSDGNVFYDNIYIGQMVEPFSDWVYDESRKAGDTGIVETEYGYHVMYFVGNGELRNYEYFAFTELYSSKMRELEAEIESLYMVTSDKEEISLIING